MDYYETIGRCISYIEQHLTDALTLNDIAHQAYISVPHLYRIFPAMTGCTVFEYIRRRRLTEAAEALKSCNRILDIAIDYQFESQESFIRAFKLMFGITPGEYRKQLYLIPLFHQIQLNKNQKTGGIAMRPDIIKKKYILAGLVTEVDLNTDFAGLITSLMNDMILQIPGIQHPVLPLRLVNFWFPHFDENSIPYEPKTMFFTGIELLSADSIPNDLMIKDLPESLYAVFKESTRGTIGGAEGYAYRTWLPSSGYRLNDEIPGDLEIYCDTEHTGYEDECEIHIPICP